MTKGIRENIFIALKIGDENDTILLPLQYISSKRWKIRFKVEKGKCKILTNMFSIIAIGWSSSRDKMNKSALYKELFVYL